MAILAFLGAVSVTGGAQRILGLALSGTRVESFYLSPKSGPLPLNLKLFSRPVSGAAAMTQIGATVAAPTASGSRIDVRAPVEWLEAVVDAPAGTGCLVDVYLTSGMESDF
jgi:hypothetical protein